MSQWYEILEYRDFSDVPRVFVLRSPSGRLVLFDCPFDEEFDESPQRFSVYRVPDTLLELTDWDEVTAGPPAEGSVALEELVFDATRRRSVCLNTACAVL